MASLVSVPTPRMFAGRHAPPPLPSLNGAPPIQLFLSGGRVYVWSADDVDRMRRDWRIYGAPVGSLPSQPLQNVVFALPVLLLAEEAYVLLEAGGAVLIDTAGALGPPPKPVDLPGVQAVPESAVVIPVDGPAPGAATAPGEPDALAADEDAAAAAAPAAGSAAGAAAGAGDALAPTSAPPTQTVFVPLATVTASVIAGASAHTLSIKALRFPRTKDERLRLDIFRDLWRRGHYMTVGVKFGGDYLVYAGDPSRYHSHFVAFVQSPRQTITPLQFVSMGRLATAVKKTFLLCSKTAAGEITYMSIEWTGII